MRAWTTKQPYAQLLAAGVCPGRVSAEDTDYRGPVAIQAAAVPMTRADLMADCERDDHLWMYVVAFGFDQQRVLDELACGAIVGIAELVNVVPAQEPGGFVPLLGDIAPGEYIYMIEDPMEIEPVRGVRGRRDLWTLDEATADAAWGAEPVATMPDLSRVDFDKASADFKVQMLHRTARQSDPARWRFKDAGLERLVSRVLREYMAAHADPIGRPRVRIDRRHAAMARLFCGAEWVSRRRFERKVRRLIGMQGNVADMPHVGDGTALELVKLMDFVTSEIDRARVEGRMEDVKGLDEGDGEVLGD